MPIPVAAWFKAWVCGRSLSRTAGSNPARGAWKFISCECCQVGVSATDRSLVQRSPTECGVSECDLETLTRRTSRHTRDVETCGGRGGMPVVVYGCKTGPLILREKYKVRVF